MIKLQDALKYLELNEKDKENMKKIAPIIQEHKDEIVDETVNMLFKEPEAVKIAQENNIPISAVKDIVRGDLEIMFPSEFGEGHERKIRQYVKAITLKVGLMPEISVLVMSLLLIKTVDKLSSLKLDNFADLSETIIKLISYFLVVRISLYNEQIIGYFLEFTGISEKLFMRQIKLQIKKEFDKNS